MESLIVGEYEINFGAETGCRVVINFKVDNEGKITVNKVDV